MNWDLTRRGTFTFFGEESNKETFRETTRWINPASSACYAGDGILQAFGHNENMGKWPGEKPQSNMLIYATWLISDLSPGHFPVFSPDARHPAWRPKAAVPESDMSVEILDGCPESYSGNRAFSFLQVNSAIAGPGRSPPWCRSGAHSPSVTSPPRQIPILKCCIPSSKNWEWPFSLTGYPPFRGTDRADSDAARPPAPRGCQACRNCSRDRC